MKFMFFLYFLAFSKRLTVHKWKNLGVIEYSKALIYMGPWSTWPQEELILKMHCFEFAKNYTDFVVSLKATRILSLFRTKPQTYTVISWF